jgi:hypothetical protein
MHLPSSSDWEREIATLEDEANRAFVNRDVERLDQLFSDALLVNSPINRVNDKQKLLELLRTGVVGHVFCEPRHEPLHQACEPDCRRPIPGAGRILKPCFRLRAGA